MQRSMTPPDRFGRFVDAQDEARTYERALSELRAGRKTTHWMWFVFPQVAGLGHSAMAKTYAISSLDEARAYLDHPLLGARLLECTRALTAHSGQTASAILGGTDAMKLRSSMTLFAQAAPDEPLFRQVLDQFFDGMSDEATEQRLSQRVKTGGEDAPDPSAAGSSTEATVSDTDLSERTKPQIIDVPATGRPATVTFIQTLPEEARRRTRKAGRRSKPSGRDDRAEPPKGTR